MRFCTLLALLLLSCSAMTKHSAPSEKEFEVPKELANKFAVEENVTPAIPVEAPKVEEVKKVELKKDKKTKRVSVFFLEDV
jgi:hypothetical protein